MPKGKNCPNCGAAYEIDKNKCPYCGTSYYDMSAVNFEDGEPFYKDIKKMKEMEYIEVLNFVGETKLRHYYTIYTIMRPYIQIENMKNF